MSKDMEMLSELNQQIGDAEDRCDYERLGCVLAPELAFRRANNVVENRHDYLQRVKGDFKKLNSENPGPASKRTTHLTDPIEIYGDRAIVKCVVSYKDNDYHNIRLFVRRDGGWKLLGWANEEIIKDAQT